MYANLSCSLGAAALLALAVAGPVRADPAADSYRVARDHYAQGRWKLAEQELRDFLATYPGHAEAMTAEFLLAEVQTQQKDYAAARQGFLSFLGRAADHRYARQALFRAGEAAYLAGMREEARCDLQRFRQQYPQDALNGYVLNYLAETELAAGNLVQAQTLYREVLQRYPSGPLTEESRFALARTLEIQGDVDAARDEYRILVHNDGRLADDAQLQLGVSFYTRGRHEEAADEFQRAVTRFPQSPLLPQARYWLGMSRLGQGRCPDAIGAFEEALAKHPEHELAPALTFWLGEAHRRSGDVRSAADCYERSADQWPRSEWADDSISAQIEIAFAQARYEAIEPAAARFDRDYGASPLQLRVQRLRGRALLKQQRFAEAVQVLQEATAAAADSGQGDAHSADGAPVETPETLADGQENLYYLALAYLGAQQPEASLQTLARIDSRVATAELQDGVRVAQATAQIALERYADAVEPLQEYLARQPDGREASQCRVQLVIAQSRTGNWEAAVAGLDQLNQQDQQHPLFWRAVFEAAEAAYAAGRYETAGTLFRRLTAGETPTQFAAKGWSGQGWADYQLGNFEAAAAAFERLVAAHPDSDRAAEARFMRARSFQRLGRRDEALEGYQALVASQPGGEHLPAALLEIARLQEAQGDKTAALATVETLIRNHPEFAQVDAALYQRAWLLTDLQRTAEAADVFQQIRDSHRQSRYWADAVYRLAERAAQTERWDQARQLAAEIVDARETRPEILLHALYLQGQLAAAAQRWDEVAPPLERLLAKFPDSPLRLPAEYWIAESRFQRQQYDLAAADFARLETQIGSRRDTWLAMIPLRQTQILMHQEKWQQAHDAAQPIAKRFPGFRQQYEVDYAIGRCLAMQARFHDARQCYERVIRSPEGGKTETAAMAQWMIGESYMHQKEYGQAIRAFHRVESLFAYPRWQAAALLQAGKCHEQLGEPGQATRLYTRLLDVHAETSFAQEASVRLRQLGSTDVPDEGLAAASDAARRETRASPNSGTPPHARDAHGATTPTTRRLIEND